MTSEPPDSVPFIHEVGERIRSRPGLSVAACGRLTEPLHGSPAGEIFVRIRAATTHDCDTAQHLLEHITGLTDLAWSYGWDMQDANGSFAGFELSLVPAS